MRLHATFILTTLLCLCRPCEGQTCPTPFALEPWHTTSLEPCQQFSQSESVDSQHVEIARLAGTAEAYQPEPPRPEDTRSWLVADWATPATLAADDAPPERPSREAILEELESLPLPSHTIEGYGGAAITPVAYLVNRGKPGTVWGRPAVSLANVVAGKKNVQAFVVTETLLRRIELGYALDRVDLGNLPDDIKDVTGLDIETHHVWVHSFSARMLLLDETELPVFLPSLTAGALFKLNDGIDDIDNRLRGGLSRLGYDKPYGTDFTLTMSKTIVHPLTLNRPLSLTVGGRNSAASQLGALGFADTCNTTVEAGVGYLITKHFLVNYEFRQRNGPYGTFPGLIGPEDNWHAVGFSLMLNQHFMINAGWAALGTLANTTENCAWYLQLKFEF